MESDMDYCDFEANQTLIAYTNSIKRMIIAAQRDTLECGAENIVAVKCFEQAEIDKSSILNLMPKEK